MYDRYFEEPVSRYETVCYECEKRDWRTEDAKVLTTRLVKMLYGDGTLDSVDLDDVVSDLCDLYDVKVPAQGPKVARVREDYFNLAKAICC